jgi:hypothetical protein
VSTEWLDLLLDPEDRSITVLQNVSFIIYQTVWQHNLEDSFLDSHAIRTSDQTQKEFEHTNFVAKLQSDLHESQYHRKEGFTSSAWNSLFRFIVTRLVPHPSAWDP